MYVESDELLMQLKDKSRGKSLSELRPGIIIANLSHGGYEIQFEYATEASKQKASLVKKSAHITIALVN